MTRFLTVDGFIAQFGEAEARQIAGSGDFNSLEGSVIQRDEISGEIAWADDLIGGYVLTRHPWLASTAPADMPNLLAGICGDLARYRLRDRPGRKGQITQTVETRYRDAIAALKDIQSGKLDIVRDQVDGVALDAPEVPGAPADGAAISGPPPQSADLVRAYDG